MSMASGMGEQDHTAADADSDDDGVPIERRWC